MCDQKNIIKLPFFFLPRSKPTISRLHSDGLPSSSAVIKTARLHSTAGNVQYVPILFSRLVSHYGFSRFFRLVVKRKTRPARGEASCIKTTENTYKNRYISYIGNSPFLAGTPSNRTRIFLFNSTHFTT